jgi:hypothetical protein
MNLERLNFVELNAQEVQETEGGMTVEQLIWAAWANTPNGGSSLWVNDGSGTFLGKYLLQRWLCRLRLYKHKYRKLRICLARLLLK